MTQEILDKARTSLERVQKFDTSSLPREAHLGADLNFKEAVAPANRLINLFRQFPLDFLHELPDSQLQNITANADAVYNFFGQILEFDTKQDNPYAARTSLLQTLENQYETYFSQLQNLISYGASRQRDFSSLERDFRASMQRAEDKASELMEKLNAQQHDAQRILDQVRKTAAEQGVSQQARYFQQESDHHESEAAKWQRRTLWAAICLGVYAVLSAFAHKWDWLAPVDSFQAFQLGLSKVLIFAVIAYMLLLSARNFLSHKHNSIVNKHRQNALLTFNALVEAAGNEERRDVILTYAAACIFSPQETGYTKAGTSSQAELPLNIIQAVPKLAGGSQ